MRCWRIYCDGAVRMHADAVDEEHVTEPELFAPGDMAEIRLMLLESEHSVIASSASDFANTLLN